MLDEHGMQSNEVAVYTMGMGTPGAVLAEFRGDPCKEPQHHHKCFAGGRGYQRGVLPCLSLSLA